MWLSNTIWSSIYIFAVFTCLIFSREIYAQTPQISIFDDSLFQTPSSPQISPNGRCIAYLVTQADFEENQYKSDLWITDVVSDSTFQLTQDRPFIYALDWFDDGDQVAFLDADEKNKSQVFSISISSREIRQITRHQNGVARYKISPDRSQIAFFSKSPPPEKRGWRKHVRSFEVGLNSYLTKEEPRSYHLWICDASGQNAEQISFGEASYSLHYGDFAWSPDGSKVAFISQPTAHTSAKYWSQIRVANLISNHVITLDTKSPVWELSFLNNEEILYGRPRNPEHLGFSAGNIFRRRVNADQSDLDSLDLDADLYLQDHVLNQDQFIISGPVGTTTKLWLASFHDPILELELNDLVPYDRDIDVHSSGAIALVSPTDRAYKELFYKKDPHDPPRQITHLNTTISNLDHGAIKSVTWTSEDGTKCDGTVTYPPNFSADHQYPLIVAIHGGPQSSAQRDLYFLPQLLASQGWIIFSPNYRGSDNQGEAFQTLIIGDPAKGPGVDIMTGIENLLNEGNVDTARLAVMGWSYGGYLTAWLVSQYQIWKAAIMGAGIADHLDMYALSDVHLFSSTLVGGRPHEKPDQYHKTSPIKYADQIKTPLLIISMSGDQRVPVTNSYRMYHALKDQGVETKFILYPTSGHTPSDPAHTRDVRIQMINWLQKHFK